MKKLIIILGLIVLFGNIATAQNFTLKKHTNGKYGGKTVTEKKHRKIQGEIEYRKKFDMAVKTFESYGMVRDEKHDVFEYTHLSWIHQYYIKRGRNNSLVIFYHATPTTPYYDKNGAVVGIFDAFHALILRNIENGALSPTVPSELHGWAWRLPYLK